MKKKDYENKDGLKFILNDDLTNDEAVEAESLLNKLTVIDRKTLVLKQTQQEQNRLFEIILIPLKPLPDGFSFGSFKGSVSAEIIADFFLAIILRAQNMISSTRRSMMQQLRRSRSTKS